MASFPHEVGQVTRRKAVGLLPLEVGQHALGQIVEMEVVCHSEGIGPDSSELMKWIGKEYPELKEEFNYLSW